MEGFFFILLFVAFYLVLQLYLLPKLGVPT
jgi:hypothetical protein